MNNILKALRNLSPRERQAIVGSVAAAALGAVLGALLYLAQDRVYRGQVLLAVVEADSQSAGSAIAQSLGGLSALAGISLPGATDKRAKYIAFLRSRAFAQRFIQANNLPDDLFPERWDAAKGAWLAGMQAPTADDLFNRFDRQIRDVREDKLSGLLTLHMDWLDRHKAASWANDFVKQANAELRARSIAEARQSLEFLEKELGSVAMLEVRQSIYKIIESQVNAVMLANVREEYAFQVIDPAVVADEDKYIRPRAAVMVAVGMGAGIALAIAALFTMQLVRLRVRSAEQLPKS